VRRLRIRQFSNGSSIGKLRLKGQIILAVLGLLVVPYSAPADEQAETLEQLRKQHQQAAATFAKTQDYGKDYRASITSAHQLISALLNHWMTLPEGSPEAQKAEQEIKTVFKDLAGNPRTERYNQGKSFMARTAWPILAGNQLTQEQAALLVELAEPQKGVRRHDKTARRGKPTEPLGWDVQAAYALALIRRGNDQQARDEIAILQKKVSINHARNPKGRLDYGPDAGEARYRNYIDYLQLCEVLHALQAAISKDHEGARKYLEQTQKLREALSPEVTPLVTEVTRQVEGSIQ